MVTEVGLVGSGEKSVDLYAPVNCRDLLTQLNLIFVVYGIDE